MAGKAVGAILLMVGGMAAAETNPLQVVVCAGQSNMQGDGQVSELPAYLAAPQPDVLFFDGREWSPLAPGKTAPSPANFGPELSFGKRFQALVGENIGLIKHSKGTTNLAVDRNPDLPASLYQQLLAKVRTARQTRPLEIVGMIWMQGERDTTREDWAEAYRDNLEALIARARKDFQSPGMFFVAGRVNPPNREWAPLVRAAQEHCSAPRYAWIDCDDLAGAENMHYGSWGYITMGNKFADALWKGMGEGADPPSGD
ncbi:MAG: hypothetical protein H7A43_05765 [Verrucomicrobia bacterium]|nr:hypothetical protein [Verrucomicrobiota bacterium]